MQMHTANNGPKIKLTEIVLHLCERFSTSSQQDNMFGFPSVNLTYTPFIKYFKGEAEKCFRTTKEMESKCLSTGIPYLQSVAVPVCLHTLVQQVKL